MSQPFLLVSACLAGVSCRYDGASSPVAALVTLCQQGRALAVCPEVDGGLPVPRPPCELREGRAMNAEGGDCTDAYLRGAAIARDTALVHGIRFAVLKAKSPSCGSSVIYDGTFTRTLIPGEGLTARMLRESGVRIMDETDADALRTFLQEAEHA